MNDSARTLNRRNFLAGTALAAPAVVAGLGVAVPMDAAAAPANTGPLPETWAYEADIIAVGGGCAGFMAACAAAEKGAQVLLLEKLSHVGGDTAVSGQTIQGIWPERVKELYGIDDSIEEYMADWKNSHFGSTRGRNGEELGTEFPYSQRELELLPGVYQWLEDAGVEWEPTGDLSPTYIYPQPIWDTKFPRSWTSNTTRIMPPLEEKATELGVEVIVNTQATQLIVNDDGRVVGVWCKNAAGERVAAKARKAVIMATGSFVGNKSMMMEYLPFPQAQVFSSGCWGSTGDGHMMAWNVGARLKNMDLGSHWIILEALTQSMVWFGAMAQFEGPVGQMPVGDTPHVLINYEGKRFMSETEGYKWTGHGVASQTYNQAYMVFDSASQLMVDIAKSMLPNELLLCQADSIEELARQMQVPADVMVEEIAKYNSYIDAGEDPDFHRHIENVTRCETAPFYAIRLMGRPYTTYGGIDVDLDGHALDTEGQVIEGLYAAGTCTYCFCEDEGLYYIGGIAQGTTFGRLAGQNAADEVGWE